MLPFYQNIPFACIFLCMASGILMPLCKKGKTAFTFTFCVSLINIVLASILLYFTSTNGNRFVYMMGHFPAPWGNEIAAGPLEALLALMFSTVIALSLLGGKNSIHEDILEPKQPLYFVMLNLLHASMLALTYTNDIFTGYVFIEINTLAACAIVMARDTAKTIAATIRYLVISLLGSGLFLIGIVLLYCITGHLLMPNLQEKVLELVATGKYMEPLTIVVGLITAGIAIKSALFPFHAWLPFAHGGATTTSSSILSGLVLKAYIILLIKLFFSVFSIDIIRMLNITDIMFVFGIMGMIYASIKAMREEHIKRMLAYSSVAQIGYVFMGLGLGTEIGIIAAVYQIIVHAVTKPLLFSSASRLSEVQGHEKSLYRLRGSARTDKLAGIAFTLGGLSMIGIPLLGGFAAKFMLAQAAVTGGTLSQWISLFALALSSVLNALYYVPAIIAIWSPSDFLTKYEAEGKAKKNPAYKVAALIFMALIIVTGCCCMPISEFISTGLSLLGGASV